MIRIFIRSWKLRELAKEHPRDYMALYEFDSQIGKLEDAQADKTYHDFEGFVNNPSELPDNILAVAEFKSMKPLKFMRDDGTFNSMTLKDAFKVAQVHLPGNELLRVNEVKVEENFCTNALNDTLKEGWRIVAVCPQPSRRPDYILGRVNLSV